MEQKCDDAAVVAKKQDKEVLGCHGDASSSETSSVVWDDADSQVYINVADGGESVGEGGGGDGQRKVCDDGKASVGSSRTSDGSSMNQEAKTDGKGSPSGNILTAPKDSGIDANATDDDRDDGVSWADASDILEDADADAEEHDEERWLDASDDLLPDDVINISTSSAAVAMRANQDADVQTGGAAASKSQSVDHVESPKCYDDNLSSSHHQDNVTSHHTTTPGAVQDVDEGKVQSLETSVGQINLGGHETEHKHSNSTDEGKEEVIPEETGPKDREEDSSSTGEDEDENGGFHDSMDVDPSVAKALEDEEEENGKEDGKKKEDTIQIDEAARLEMEELLPWDEKQARRDAAQEHKKSGNELFKNEEFLDAVSAYTEGLDICPLSFKKERSIMFANRAACHVRLEHHDDATEDCTKALELNPVYLKVYIRRAQVYELTEKLDEALGDYTKALELDPGNYQARGACLRLPEQIKERNEKLKEEMMGKLKDLGNLCLRPFGLSTNNFQLQQDPNTGGYSVNFSQNPGNNGN